jgi:hypothetical protein
MPFDARNIRKVAAVSPRFGAEPRACAWQHLMPAEFGDLGYNNPTAADLRFMSFSAATDQHQPPSELRRGKQIDTDKSRSRSGSRIPESVFHQC